MHKTTLLFTALVLLTLPARGADKLDLTDAVIVIHSPETIFTTAADLLRDEVTSRTRLDLSISNTMPSSDRAAIVLYTIANPPPSLARAIPVSRRPDRPEGFAIRVDSTSRPAPTIHLIGYDNRGVLYAAGRFLRELDMGRDQLEIVGDLEIRTSPKVPLRGHQVGNRPKTNAYDAWSVKIWEQYFRDLVVFGSNTIELIPPTSDDDDDSPHFVLPKMEMMIAMSRLADKYELDVSIWYPIVDDDDLSHEAVEKALHEREEIFRQLPRIDAVFVPGGDPGEINPLQLLPLMEKQKEVLNRHHPSAQIWVSPQGFDWDGNGVGWLESFYDILNREQPEWLDGVVFGPQVRDNLKILRERVPAKYPIRRYPDITHCLDAQYSVPDWDPAFHLTLYREPINPRPRDYDQIFRDWDEYAVGYITYSEGVNDDVNKFIWSGLGWDPEAQVEDILRDYSKYFIGRKWADSFTEGILGLEQNWKGPLLSNFGVYETLRIFQEMESDANPQDLLNWRFQLALYRAYYDAYVRRRLIHETELEQQAMDVLRTAEPLGSVRAIEKAEAILERSQSKRVASDWRSRTFEIAEALFQSIRMQLSVDRYQAQSTRRGANLDLIDVPLNNAEELQKLFAEIRQLPTEEKRLERINWITAHQYLMKMEHDKRVILQGIQ